MEKYDVVIIGAGIGGMTAANKLGKSGYSVLLIEQHDKLGGLASWFRQGNHIFDISLHGYPVGMKNAFRMHWSQELSDSVIKLEKIIFDNPQFYLQTTYEEKDFRSKLYERFKLSKKVIDKLFVELRKLNLSNNSTMSVKELFDNFFSNRNDVVRVLLEPITYANGLTLRDPASIFATVFLNFMKSGVYTFEGGSDKMIKKMTEELTRNNVTISTKTLAEKILVKREKVYGVIANGKEIKAKSVVSNSNLLSTIHTLIGDKYFTLSYIEKVKKVRLSTSSCQVYIGIKRGQSLSNIGDIIFTSDQKKFDPMYLCAENSNCRSFSIYYPKIRPRYNDYTIVSTSKARYEDWSNLSEKEYEESKKRLIKSTIDGIEKYLPGVKKKIDYIEAATPKTFEKYTLHSKGATFGTKFEGLNISMGLSKHIKGLFHTGSVGIITSGWLGTANYGAIVSHSVDRYLRYN